MENTDAELYSLIDRLKKCSEIKYPNRPWTPEFYEHCAFLWKDKITELKERVELLETKIREQNS